MQVIRYHSAEELLLKAEFYLEKKEAVNNLLLGILFSLINKSSPNQYNSELFFAAVEEEEEEQLLIVMLMTPPYNLVIYGEGEKIDEAIKLSVSYLLTNNIAIPGVIGQFQIATNFAKVWEQRTGCSSTIKMKQRIYKLEKVKGVKLSPGKIRTADINDIEFVSDWVYRFSEDILEKITLDNARKFAKEAIKRSSVYLWQEKEPVSIAAYSRPTKNGISVNLVYTPPKFRNKGYATSCVASLSKLLLQKGYKFCTLYTDLLNPTSNSIYIKIGYKPIADSIVYNF